MLWSFGTCDFNDRNAAAVPIQRARFLAHRALTEGGRDLVISNRKIDFFFPFGESSLRFESLEGTSTFKRTFRRFDVGEETLGKVTRFVRNLSTLRKKTLSKKRTVAWIWKLKHHWIDSCLEDEKKIIPEVKYVSGRSKLHEDMYLIFVRK